MQLFTNLFVLISVFQIATAVSEKFPAAELVVRQTTTTATAAGGDPCLDYSVTANMSVISANSSYRAAFMQKAPVGTLTTAKMLNAAQVKLPALTKNEDLNNRCGNLTTLALTEAAKNFTNGIVAQFTTEGLPVGIKAGPEVILVVAASCTIFSVVWIFSG
ncbi:hypothetical protein CC80DRAFT_79900 [Byssothecium circinans]|uniref:Uncharacterized protein n=1 Tax=Byssothecium circinans TaxID=147558 RepID=A0A6A5TUY0_9PLEO|nr:hypothetical protein CC80DRAFT_79900 [Byssothecium circinans]